MTLTRRAGLTVATILMAVAFAACGGATATGGTGTAEPAASDAAAPEDPAPSGALALPSFDLSSLITNLDGVDSYRLTVSTGGDVSYDGVVVTKPELSRDVTMGDQRIVIIGDEVWMGTAGADDLTPAPAEMASAFLSLIDPVVLVGAFATPGAMAGATEVGSEDKNGVPAKHFRIDASSMIGTLASMPPDSSIDVWIADDGYLVSLAVTGIEGSDFTLDVTNVNDPANVVERPS
jgi:hypothetical protein